MCFPCCHWAPAGKQECAPSGSRAEKRGCRGNRRAHPGGCVIGERPIDLHLSVMHFLGAEKPALENNLVSARCRDGIRGGTVCLRYPSVGATENAIMGSVFAKEEVHIHGCAREPEIVDLQNYLNCCGADIRGAGSAQITVKGVPELKKYVEYTVVPDRIEAGTYLIAGAMSGEDVMVRDLRASHLQALLQFLQKCGCTLQTARNQVRIRGGLRRCRLTAPELVIAKPYPGFPTDLQAPIAALLTLTSGKTLLYDSVFESRYRHMAELCKMGACCSVEDIYCSITGVERLHGTRVVSTDLRAGAALILAGLAACGETVVEDAGYIDRGYMDICGKLTKIGAQIKKFYTDKN